MSEYFCPSSFVSNLNANVTNRIIHIAFNNANRSENARRFYPRLPNTRTLTFCNITRYQNLYTEDYSKANCQDCIRKAFEYGYMLESSPAYTSVSNSHSDGTIVASRTVENLTKWIPVDCEIIICHGSIKIIDKVTKQEVVASDLNDVCSKIIKIYFQSYSPSNIIQNNSILSKSIFLNDKRQQVKGLAFNPKNGVINGVLIGDNNRAVTFEDLLTKGYCFENGTPCGNYIKNTVLQEVFADFDIETM